MVRVCSEDFEQVSTPVAHLHDDVALEKERDRGAKIKEGGRGAGRNAGRALQPVPSPKRAAENTAVGPITRALTLQDKAHTLLAQSNFELAIRFLSRALEMDAGNLEARELLGVAELEGGDEEVKEVYSVSVDVYVLDS